MTLSRGIALTRWIAGCILAPVAIPVAHAQDVSIVTIAAASNEDGRPEVFAIGTDGNAYHRWRQSSSPTDWSEWTLAATGRFSKVVVRRAADARLYLFGLDDGKLVIRAQVSPNGSWSDASYRSGDQLRDLSVAQSGDGHFTVTAIGGNGGVWTMSGLRDQSLTSASWSEWSSLGGTNLARVASEQDGDGRVVVVGLGKDNRLSETRQFSSTESAVWTEWLSLGTDEFREVALMRGADRKLWMIAAGLRSGLFARALAPTTPAPVNKLAVVPAPPRNPRTERAGSHDVALASVGSTPLPDAWTSPTTLEARQLLTFTELSLSRSANGPLELYSVAHDFVSGHAPNAVVHIAQDASGTWPTDRTVLPLDKRIAQFTQPSSTVGRDGSNTIFVVDGASGRAYVLTRMRAEKWTNQTWLYLGKIPGVAAADFYFQAGTCLEKVPHVADAAALRATIATGVSDNLERALGGSALADLAEAPRATSRCVGQREVMGLWLNHEVYAQALADADILPKGEAAVFAMLLPEATLKTVFAKLWESLPKSMGFDGDVRGHDVTLHGYEVILKAPDKLILSIAGSTLTLDFHVRVTANLGVASSKPQCSVQVQIDKPDDLIRGISWAISGFFMALPVNRVNDLADAVLRGKLARTAPLVCGVTDAFLTQLYLPVPAVAESAQVLEIAYDKLVIVETGADTGILAYGSALPSPRTRVPSLALRVSPSGAAVGLDRIQVSFDVSTVDIQPPFSVTWQPDYPNATRLLSPQTLWTSQTSPHALFEFVVAPSNVVLDYNLGTMTVKVTGADGIARQTTAVIKALVRPRKAPSP